ncbi:MAG: nuclear transport factor 2 family protein [Verrucomicrobiia bacterium]
MTALQIEDLQPNSERQLRPFGLQCRCGGALFGAALIWAMSSMPGLGQEHALTEWLSGKVHPLQVILKDFGPDWRRISISTAAAASDNLSVNVSGNTAGSTSQNNLTGGLAGSRAYVTLGETVSVADRQYLVAYHLPAGALDIPALIEALVAKTPPRSNRLTPESRLHLSLLDFQTIGSLDEIRAFDWEAEVQESARATERISGLFSPAGAKEDAEAQVRKRLQEVFSAAQAKDLARLDSYHLYGPKFTKFDANSRRRLGAEAARQGEHSGLGALTNLSLRADDLKIDVFGDAAVATLIMRARAEQGDQTIDTQHRGTVVFIKDSGSWKIAHEHFSSFSPEL